MLQAIEMRKDLTTAPSVELLMAVSTSSFMLGKQLAGGIQEQEEYRKELIKVAAVAMRLATRPRNIV